MPEGSAGDDREVLVMTTRKCGGILACACVIAGLAGGCQSPSPEAAKAAGNGWSQTEGPKDKTAGAAMPERDVLPRTHYAAGRLHESQNRLERAVEQYRAAVTLDPKYVDAYNGLGVCLTRLGRYREAEEHLLKAIELAPDRAHLRNNLAFCYISQRRWADAEAELRNALELKPNFARARINLAMSLAQQGKFDPALQEFRAVLKEGDAQFNMGLMYQSVGRYAEAGEAFRAALEKNPRMVAARERLEKLRPMLDKARAERPKAEPYAVAPATRPAHVAAGSNGAAEKIAASKAPGDEKATLEAQSEPSRSRQQASPLPRVPADVVPAAREALTTLTGIVKRLMSVASVLCAPHREAVGAGGTPEGPFRVICEATAAPSVPEDLDIADNLWLSVRDPAQAAAASEHVAALEEGAREAAEGVRGEPAAADPAQAEAAPPAAGRERVGGSILIGAMLLPDDPFRAFPQR